MKTEKLIFHFLDKEIEMEKNYCKETFPKMSNPEIKIFLEL